MIDKTRRFLSTAVLVASFFTLLGLSSLTSAQDAEATQDVPPTSPVVPTVSEWGLIVMAVLLVSIGAIVIWRWRRVAA